MSETCAWCGAVRLSGTTCAKCGADYEKAAAIRAEESLKPVPVPELATGVVERPVVGRVWTQTGDDLERELQLRLYAPPAALILAVLFHASHLGHFLQRTFLSMMVHGG